MDKVSTTPQVSQSEYTLFTYIPLRCEEISKEKTRPTMKEYCINPDENKEQSKLEKCKWESRDQTTIIWTNTMFKSIYKICLLGLISKELLSI